MSEQTSLVPDATTNITTTNETLSPQAAMKILHDVGHHDISTLTQLPESNEIAGHNMEEIKKAAGVIAYDIMRTHNHQRQIYSNGSYLADVWKGSPKKDRRLALWVMIDADEKPTGIKLLHAKNDFSNELLQNADLAISGPEREPGDFYFEDKQASSFGSQADFIETPNLQNHKTLVTYLSWMCNNLAEWNTAADTIPPDTRPLLLPQPLTASKI